MSNSAGRFGVLTRGGYTDLARFETRSEAEAYATKQWDPHDEVVVLVVQILGEVVANPQVVNFDDV